MSTVQLITYEQDRDTGVKTIKDLAEFDFELSVLKSGKFSAGVDKAIKDAFQLVADSSGNWSEVGDKPKYSVVLESVMRDDR